MAIPRTWSLAALVTCIALGAIVALPRAEAKDPEPAALAQVRAALKTLTTTTQGPVPGTPKAKALPMLVSWAKLIHEYRTPLDASPYALGSEARGVVRIYLDEGATDDLSIHLLFSGVERERMLEFVMEVGRELGYDMSPDDESPWACMGFAEGRRDLWVGVGVGIVSIEVNVP